ncbi:MAG: sulfatase-like hydrolase/transferase [Abditibacteriales bacterium]|nr:sulfatase-like hydrolase/transferase [Abditibacteriales bacterium]MDW8366633.1 sulfatase-like hydrolase/transferase [Abditibacteriales bacterium]
MRGLWALICMLSLTNAVWSQSHRPNFVFIYTDDQRWDALGVVQREQGERARFPWFKTPNLDKLAEQGVRFRNAFVVNALCSPSRACFLTGRYNHLNGIANNRTPFDPNSVTHASLLRQAGYTTGYIGKWHMGSQSGQRPGFDYSASFIGQGRFHDCPFEINGVVTPTKGWVDDVSTDFAIAFLKKNRDKPFLLCIGYKSSHGPWEPPERLKNALSDVVSKPAVNADATPPYLQRDANPNPPAAQVAMHRNYFRTLIGVDENVGRILNALDELQLAENTVVIFTSDNGFYLGEHGLGDKRSAYEESMRIPFLVRYPKLGVQGKVVDEMILNIDLAPTLLDFAGVPIPKEMQGRSWKPLLTGEAKAWRKAFFYEYFWERNFSTPTVLAVRTETAKLIKYPGHDDWTELFDLQADPYERRNLANDPAFKSLREQMEQEFERQAEAVAYRLPPYADELQPAPPPARRLNKDVLVYDFSRDEGDRVVDISGNNNHGEARGVPLVAGREGRKARRFDGKGLIEVPKSPTLDCSGGAWTVEVVVKAEQPNGVLLARGGNAQGYAMHLVDGRPVFSVTAQNRTTHVEAPQAIVGAWTQLVGVITADQQIVLYVNGAEVARRPLPAFIPRDPNETMQLGADSGSQVAAYKAPGFVGLIESVRIFSGERK